MQPTNTKTLYTLKLKEDAPVSSLAIDNSIVVSKEAKDIFLTQKDFKILSKNKYVLILIRKEVSPKVKPVIPKTKSVNKDNVKSIDIKDKVKKLVKNKKISKKNKKQNVENKD